MEKNPENLDPKIFKTKNSKIIMQPECAACGIKKSRFVKEQEAKGLLSSLGIKTSLNKKCIKMNEIVNKFLLVGDKFMPEIHLKQPGFTHSACGLFTKNKERIAKLIQTGNANFICRNELDETCFQHDGLC